MQKTRQVEHPERDFVPTGDPLAGSGFEQEPTDSEFGDGTEDEEANAN
jgi:hypothetical protein